MNAMNRLDELLLFVLDRANKGGKHDLSKFQMYKIPYLLQIYSIKYAGTPFVKDTQFIRKKDGPISIDIQSALERLENGGYVRKEIVENKSYGHSKHAYSLGEKKVNKFNFDSGEQIFLDNFLSELLPLTQTKLKNITYATEPMQDIQLREKARRSHLYGVGLDFATVAIDPDVIEAYSD